MKAEDLISMTAARGVDLVQAARIAAIRSANHETIRKNGATVLMPPSNKRARGSATRSIERPEWTIAELGQAAQGVPPILFHAAMYAFAGDRTHYWTLHTALFHRAVVLAWERHWPSLTRDIHQIQQPYLAHLAKLVLDEDSMPNQFHFPTLGNKVYAIYMNLEEKTWDNEVAERYADLMQVWVDWLQTAGRIIQRHLAEEELS